MLYKIGGMFNFVGTQIFNMHFRKFIAAVAVCLAICQTASAQRTPPRIEDLPKISVDTVMTGDPDTYVILYSNNTWSYYRPNMDVYDDLHVFSTNWIDSHVFAYRNIELKDLPEVVDLNVVYNEAEFFCPYQGRVTHKYGPRGRRNHNGVDIPLKIGEPVYAAFEGKVRYSKLNTGGFGNLVIIRHKNGLETWYAHLSKRNIEEGEYVKPGQVLGYGGTTGRSTGAHLHFEMRYCDQSFDPEFIIDFENGRIKTHTFALQKSYFNIHSRATDMLDEDDSGAGYDYRDLLDPNIELLAELGDSTAVALLASEEFRKKQAEAKAKEELKKAQYHTVRSGDMLGKISQRYGVSVSQLCRLNNIKTTSVLSLGQRIRVR